MAKRTNDFLNLSEVLNDFKNANKLTNGLDKVNIREAWANLMGRGVTNYTDAVEFKRDTLYIRLSSSVLREELSYGKEKIIKMLNEELGKNLIKKLVLV